MFIDHLPMVLFRVRKFLSNNLILKGYNLPINCSHRMCMWQRRWTKWNEKERRKRTQQIIFFFFFRIQMYTKACVYVSVVLCAYKEGKFQNKNKKVGVLLLNEVPCVLMLLWSFFLSA